MSTRSLLGTNKKLTPHSSSKGKPSVDFDVLRARVLRKAGILPLAGLFVRGAFGLLTWGSKIDRR